MTRLSSIWTFVALLAFVTADPAYAAGGGEKSAMTFVWEVVNFVLLVGALVYFARKPIIQFFADRRSGIGGELESAANVLEEAEARFGEWQQKMAELDSELASIRDRERRRAEQERERILGDARQAAGRIRADAESAVDREFRRAQIALRAEATEVALELATQLLSDKVADADRDRLIDEFISRVEQTSLGDASGS